MKKQLAIAAGALLALGTAVAANLGNDARQVERTASVQSASDLDSQTAVQLVSLWKDYANSAPSTYLARPL